ncbi:helix-turn-helix transcriptional regulator [Priestia aryabhattai]|uniref:helix-turn-helix domain-containing protein n=1 Tax=Priestia aryabhattai TaxID=412384 RepID=UPI001C8E7E96|nr:helix-turn-helix transcriptional regulator [Priestia aryabhattai]MBX9967229.1 helix-turn-helix transcriptional regulator [Priestia aryabhattai]
MNKLEVVNLEQQKTLAVDQEAEIDQEIAFEVRENKLQPVVDTQFTLDIKSVKTSKYDKFIGGNLTMTTFNKQGIRLAEEIKTNPEYNFIKKEALIQFGFKSIILKEFVEWVSYSYTVEFEDITGEDIQNERTYTLEMINLLDECEYQEIDNISKEDDPNQIVGYITGDGRTIPATHDIENERRKKRFIKVNKKEWFELGQALKEERLELGISLTKMGQLLDTSPSRISNMENGKGVTMANHLRASYKLVLELERIKQQEK